MKKTIRASLGAVLFALLCAHPCVADPLAITGIILWLDGDDINANGSTPIDNSLVSVWKDKSGNGHHASVASAAKQPSARLNSFGCRTSVYFHNLDRGLKGSFTRSQAEDMTIFISAHISADNRDRNALMEVHQDTLTGSLGNYRTILFQNSIWPKTYPRFDTEALNTITITDDNNTFIRYQNGTPMSSGNTTSPWGIQKASDLVYVLGDDYTGADRLLDSYINEVLIYDRVLTASERSIVEEYLDTKWKSAPVSGCGVTPPSIQVEKSVTVFDPDMAGLFSIPSTDMSYKLTVVNTGGDGPDPDSFFIVDAWPDELEFYNGDYNPSNSGMGPVNFISNTKNLTFAPSTDIAYSNSKAAPDSFAKCTHVPEAGYTTDIKYVCINPKGYLPEANPVSQFSIEIRGRVK